MLKRYYVNKVNLDIYCPVYRRFDLTEYVVGENHYNSRQKIYSYLYTRNREIIDIQDKDGWHIFADDNIEKNDGKVKRNYLISILKISYTHTGNLDREFSASENFYFLQEVLSDEYRKDREQRAKEYCYNFYKDIYDKIDCIELINEINDVLF